MSVRAMTWEQIVGKVHPDWPRPTEGARSNPELRKRRIRNVAWAHGYSVDDHGVVNKGK